MRKVTPLRALILTASEQEYQGFVQRLQESDFAVQSLQVREQATFQAALKAQPWDIILCDYSLPHFSPTQALALVQESGLDIPFIVVSEAIQVPGAVDIMRRGAHNLLLREEMGRLGEAVYAELEQLAAREQERQFQAALRTSEERYRTLFEQAPVGIVEADFHDVKQLIADLQKEVTDLRAHLNQNPHTFRLLVKAIEVKEVNWQLRQLLHFQELREFRDLARELAHAEWREALIEIFARLATRERSFELEAPFSRTDDQKGYVLIRISIMAGHEHDWSRVLFFFVDITERKQMEQQLAAEQEQLRIILHSITEGVIATDKEGRLQLLNSAAEHILGQSQLEAQGKFLSDVLTLQDKAIGTPLYCEIQKTLQEGNSISWQGVYVNPRGEKFTLACLANPLRNRAGEIVGAVLVLRDISEEERRQQELIRLEKIASLELLASGLAHNFNNLLAAISTSLQLCQLLPPEDPQYAEILRKAIETTYRARGLIQQLLTFAKGGAPKKEITHLAPLVQDMAQLSVSGAPVKLEFAAAPDLWPVEADSSQIAQVVNNLVLNAVQAMPEGGTVRVGLHNVHLNGKSGLAIPPGDYVALRVEDEGPGIPPELLERIFEPYFTTKEGGSGLGLTSCQSIIRQHGGEIAVCSEVGKGSVFTVYLPRCRPPLSPN